MDASFVLRGKRRGIMDEEEEEDGVGSMLSSLSGEEDEGSSNSVGSSSSDFVEDAASSSGSSSSNSIGGDDDHAGGGGAGGGGGGGPLFEMSSLISHLPFKRGLSKHFQGKSQSFTSLADVRSLEDLVKPERPFRKKLKSSRSYAGGLDSSRAISKKGSRGPFSSLSSKRQQHSFLGSRPPVPPHRSGSCLSGQTLLFA